MPRKSSPLSRTPWITNCKGSAVHNQKSKVFYVITSLLLAMCFRPALAEDTNLASQNQSSQEAEKLQAVARVHETARKLLIAKISQLELKFDSPDNAVRSWWAINKAKKEVADLVSLTRVKLRPALSPSAYAAVIHPRSLPFHSSSKPSIWSENQFIRSISKVKIESESRASVFATVQLGQSALDGLSKKERESAVRNSEVRYVLSKSNGRWLIEDIQKRPFEFEKSQAIEGQWISIYKDTRSNEAYLPVSAL